MKTYKIHLIRHGATDANTLGRYIGNRTDMPLSPEGLDELRMLKESVDYPAVERVYSSPMMRCRQTAAVLYPDKETIPVDELTEYDFGAFEGMTADELEGTVEYAEWTAGKTEAPPGGESTVNFIKRIVLGINMIVQDMMNNDITESAVIMHGGATMMLLGNTAVPRRRSVEWTSENGRGFSVRITPSLYHSSGIIEVYDEI